MHEDCNMQFLEKLGITNTFKDFKRKSATQSANKDEWIRAGVMNAYALELLQMQLQHKTSAEKKQIARSLKYNRNPNQTCDWQNLVKDIIRFQVLSEADKTTSWSKHNNAIEHLRLSKEQLLSISLSMAKQRNVEGAAGNIIKLLKQEEAISTESISTICIELVRFFSHEMPKDNEYSNSKTWANTIRLHSNFLKMLSIIAESGLDTKNQADAEISRKIVGRLEAIKMSSRKRPDEVSQDTWKILQDISYCNTDPQLPNFFLVESQSLPRSGHHYLKNLLQAATKGRFSYCETYQEPGCCESNPCGVNSYWRHARNKNESHLRLIKSHDFELNNKTFNCTPGMHRLIQIREPFDLLVSWLELAQLHVNEELLREKNIDILRIYLYHEAPLLGEAWEIIDLYGTTMNTERARMWLLSKKEYIESFLNKWIPRSQRINSREYNNYGNYVLHYQEMQDPSNLLKLLKIKNHESTDLPIFNSYTDILERKSEMVTRLVKENSTLIQEIGYDIKESTPLLADGSSAWKYA